MASLKPITLYGHPGPNPWKVVIILEELGIPYHTEYLAEGAIKQEPFLSINPNGRSPAIVDPNTNVTLWESGAIAEYLIETYDKDHKLSFTSSPERFLTKQWTAFQISGQGPPFGQAVWFTFYHSEKLPSAVERFLKEMERIVSVLELHFEKTGGKYLVGDRFSYADIMFIPWSDAVVRLNDGLILQGGKYPKYQDWIARLKERPAVKKALEDKDKVLKVKH